LNHVGVGENESGKGPTRDDGATRGGGRREGGGSEASAMVAILTADEGGERRTGKRRERERERGKGA